MSLAGQTICIESTRITRPARRQSCATVSLTEIAPRPCAPMIGSSIQAVKRPAEAPSASQGRSGGASRRHASEPRRHHQTTSSSAGSVAVTVLLSRANANSRKARPGAWPPGLVKSNIDEGGSEIEHRRERTLLFRYPGYGFNAYRM